MDVFDIQSKVRMIKESALKLCVRAGTGHVTTAFSCAEIMAVLYYDVMKIDVKNPLWGGRDRFIMSKNHGSVITYPILADLGFVSCDDIQSFLLDGSVYGSHSKMSVKGVDFAGGSLGIGFGVACGIAYSAKVSGEKFLIFCLVGDGELYEGSIWEAAMFAGGNHLDNLVVIVDKNNMCVTDFIDKMLTQDSLKEKWESFNFEVREIDGHSIGAIKRALEDVRIRQCEKPLCIIAETVKGKGISFMENNVFMHGVAPTGDKARKAFLEMQKRYDNE